MKKIFTYYLSVLSFFLIIIGCSELKSDLPQEPVLTVHSDGILDQSSPDFHGNVIKMAGWDMRNCQQCHASDYNGSSSASSCFTCHTELAGPENCSTCHGSDTSPAPPKDLDGNTSVTDRGVGAHQVHLTGNTVGKTLSCAECHSVPGSVYQEGHVDTEGTAEVMMNNFLANLNTNDNASTFIGIDPNQPIYIPEPAYNESNGSCSNTYCHGYFKNGNLDNTPVWNDPSSAVCGTCHGDPTRPTLIEQAMPKTVNEGGYHPASGTLACSTCHDGVVNDELEFINPSKHIDGKVNIFGNDYEY